MPTNLPSGRDLPRFAGVSTFFRFPRWEDVPDEHRPLDWALYGVPYDGGTTYRPGARFGPRAIREQSQYLKPYHLELDVNIAERLSMADAGDAPVRPYSPSENHGAVTGWAENLPGAGHTRLFAIGGDHSIAASNIRATWERLGRPAGGLPVLHLDAHLDTVDEVWGERHGHASPFIRAIEGGWIDPARMLSVGIRGPLNTSADLAFGREHGIAMITMADLDAGRAFDAIDAWRSKVGDTPVYVTIDIDCIDPAFAPGTGTPMCGGLTSREVMNLLRGLRGIRIAGADLVEVLPDRDPADVTALLAAHLVMEVLALDAVARA
jgi:agmatinase